MNDQHSFAVPVLLIMFNRPKQARQVFDRIKQIQPSQLFVAVDGPRQDNADDRINVQACIDLLKEINWPCKIEKLIRKENRGCKKAVSSAISWFFDRVEYGIILEDDCLPDLTFFKFCEVLLEKYKDTPSIMHIGGANLYNGTRWGDDSYFFSSIPHIWGWATWRRAWSHYDINMEKYPRYKQERGLQQSVIHAPSLSFWKRAFDAVYAGNVDTWDYQWVFTVWLNKGLCVIPDRNLISNIGFNAEATHTTAESEFANIPTVPILIEQIKHPHHFTVNKEALEYAFAKFYVSPSLWQARISRLKRLFTSYVK